MMSTSATVKKEEEASRSPHPACAEEEQRGSVTHGGQYGGKNTDGWMDGWAAEI